MPPQDAAARRKKDLILLVGSCCFGALIRGLQNLETPRRGTVLFFSLVRKEPKVPQRFANLWTPGSDSKLCRKRFCKVFRRLVSKPVLPAKRRRKGFESVRKGYCSADARLMFFEKELLYSKLTVRFHRQNLWLHVSLGAVRSCCRGALRKSFSLSVSFA